MTTEHQNLFDQLKSLSTEERNPASMDLDAHSIPEILTIINKEDQRVALSVQDQIPYIARAVEVVVHAFQRGGRLIYVGAGTSGRLGVVDAAECPPTFGTKPEMIQGLIAGGDQAMFRAQEGAEDKEKNGAHDIDKKEVNNFDVVCGIAASLRTPYVVGAVKQAKLRGAKIIYITTNPRTTFNDPEFENLKSIINVAICPEVGPEVIMGSTRMKSGTAQKLVLNMITTTAMIRLGKVYENMMIDLQMTNQKLYERAKRIVMTITGVSYEEAEKFLTEANYHVKTALVMIQAKVGVEEAAKRLAAANGFVRTAIKNKL
ncbi:MAG TPA: N-acetylmuramic acid 6-phosphate etherase [Bacteroidota bacterium]|nr:N-acetylmuramic acid 6-phosphate etherase [Bacteroidota bacterium]